ncbi:MAG: hypothetical protein BAX61_13365 [Psychrobacter sp. B29-1]|uniref:hypothetical protein n=1 Tax=Psychrobacter sp. B29-1 TaxID=1867800 RepID=UPI00086F8134|nr:hypothetical protein [Psychrobacter sp. B29-1]OEH66788.1 MAG: hypothetical protein BAX61_13365 [Psychrobacter sp. B29-1]
MKHPLYNKVQKIVAAKIADGKINHSEFAHIRNQASVRAILADMGYKPNCTARPLAWKIPTVRDMPDELVIDSKPKDYRVSATNPNSKSGDIKRRFLNNELLRIDSLSLDRKPVITLMHRIRKEGYQMEINRFKGSRRIESFRLISEQ